MYCVNCGVKLADTEQKCPLCNALVQQPKIKQQSKPLYPSGKMPKPNASSKALNGALLILYVIPLVVCVFADLQFNGKFDWFGYVAGALVVAYITFALPHWFRKPNPVIFTPCIFVAVALYLLYIDIATGGDWFMGFAFPVAGVLGLISCAVVTLLYYLKRGRLYIFGGAFIALGLLMLLIEYLLKTTFAVSFIGWSIYPLVVLSLFGGFLIFIAINGTAREMMERKLFF